MPLLSLDKKGKAPRERVRDATAIRNIFTKMRDDELVNSANRAECHALRDGEPPFVTQQIADANQGDMTNINCRGAEMQVERAMSPYYRLVQSPENIASVKTTYGPVDERGDWEAIMNEEISATIRRSSMFTFQTLLLIKNRQEDGLGVGYFSDDLDWRYRGAGREQFFFDRQAFACEDEQQVVCAIEDYSVTRLYAAIEREDAEEESEDESGEESEDESGDGMEDKESGDDGWNREAVIRAIMKAADSQPDYKDWERLQDEIKNNDLGVSRVCQDVQAINLWVEEFDGTWSHYMTTEQDTGEDFLYKCRGKYRSLGEVMVLFPDGIGANAKIHGYRGLLYKIYPMEQQLNRSICRLIDQGLLASSITLQAGDESSLADTGLEYLGNRAVLAPGWNVVTTAMPDLQKSVVPSIDMMERLRNDRVAGYSVDNVFDGDQRKTKGEVYAHLEQSASLNDAQLDMHYGPYERLLQQTIRRMTRRTYVPQDPGGREIADLRTRLVRREVPLEAFYQIDHKETRVVRAIGGGSAAAKTVSLERVNGLRGGMDDVGQYKLLRDLSMDAVGAAKTEDYFPVSGIRRTTADTNIAELESNQLLAGMPVTVKPSDKHLAHAREHVKPLLELFTAEQDGKIPIEEAAMQMRALFIHATEHVDAITGDPDTVEEAAAMRQDLQQIGEVVSNGLKRAEEMAQQQAEEGGPEEGGEPQGGPTPEQIKEVEAHRQTMEMKREKFDLEQQQRIDKERLDAALKDARTAADIARERAKSRATTPS